LTTTALGRGGDMLIRPRVSLVVVILCAAFSLLALLHSGSAPTAHLRIITAATAQHGPAQTSLDIALTGTATADTEAAGSPASNAIDGSASTDWCATQWTGSVTVDLGRVRTLDGLGLTLGSTATTALVNFSAGDDPSALKPVPGATQQSAPAGDPAYWPTQDHPLSARYVKVDVTDTDGTPPCIGE